MSCTALRELLIRELGQEDATRFSDVHLQNLIDKGYTDHGALNATCDGLQSPPLQMQTYLLYILWCHYCPAQAYWLWQRSELQLLYFAMQLHEMHTRRYLGQTIGVALFYKLFISISAIHQCNRVYLAMVQVCINSQYVLQESWERECSRG